MLLDGALLRERAEPRDELAARKLAPANSALKAIYVSLTENGATLGRPVAFTEGAWSRTRSDWAPRSLVSNEVEPPIGLTPYRDRPSDRVVECISRG